MASVAEAFHASCLPAVEEALYDFNLYLLDGVDDGGVLRGNGNDQNADGFFPCLKLQSKEMQHQLHLPVQPALKFSHFFPTDQNVLVLTACNQYF